MNQNQAFQVNRAEADKFSKIWTHKGVAIFMDDVHLQFATDFANVVLNSFIQKMQAQAQAAQKAAQQPKVILAED